MSQSRGANDHVNGPLIFEMCRRRNARQPTLDGAKNLSGAARKSNKLTFGSSGPTKPPNAVHPLPITSRYAVRLRISEPLLHPWNSVCNGRLCLYGQ